MNGEPWNALPRQEEKVQVQDRACIALKHLIKSGGQTGSMTCCEHVGSNLWDLKARTQGVVDNEFAQGDRVSSNISPGTPLSLSSATICKVQAVTQRWLRVDPRRRAET